MNSNAPPVTVSSVSRVDYLSALRAFDAAVCEALAVGQKQAGRHVPANVGYATYVFARMCGSATDMIRAVPLSRWVRSDFEDWSFSAVAGCARAILEGYLYFRYLIAATKSEDEMKTRINILYINDCTRRIDLHRNLEAPQATIDDFEKQCTEVRERLHRSEFFATLHPQVQKKCLSGKYLMSASRDEMLEQIGFDRGHFNALFDLWSQHTHILPLSFFRMEPNGRGSGLENDVDRSYIAGAMAVCTELLVEATDLIVTKFPDVAGVRSGTRSMFSPGPHSNRPRQRDDRNMAFTSSHSPKKNQIAAIVSKGVFAELGQTRGENFTPSLPKGRQPKVV